MNESARKHYESIGIEGVLDEIARGVFGPGKSVARNEAESWIAAERHRLEATDSAKRSAREIETLSIAKEANRLASEANSIARLEAAAAARSSRYAMYAAAIATTAAIVAAKDEIWSLIAKLL